MDWLQSLLDMLDPAPAPDGCTLALYLYRYQAETDRLEQALAEPAEQRRSLRDRLTALARQDIARSRAILRDLDAHQQLAKLDTAVARFADIQLADNYPEIRRVIKTCFVDASLDGYRMDESGVYDAMVGEMVDSASDALFALTADIPAAVAHAKCRAVEHPSSRSCNDAVGRLLAVQAAHLPPGAKILEMGAGVGIATAWLVAGLGSRTDVEILSVEAGETLSATTRTYDWPRYVRIETADPETALVDHPGAFDLILADTSASSFDHLDAIVGASRPGGMLIFVHDAVTAALGAAEATPLSALHQTALRDDKLVAVGLDWSGGLLIAAKRR